MNNKYTDVGIALGTIADHIRANGGTPIERDYHAVLVRLLDIAEKQASEIANLKAEISKLEGWIKNMRR